MLVVAVVMLEGGAIAAQTTNIPDDSTFTHTPATLMDTPAHFARLQNADENVPCTKAGTMSSFGQRSHQPHWRNAPPALLINPAWTAPARACCPGPAGMAVVRS